MEIQWRGRYAELVDTFTRFSNNYAANWQKELYTVEGITISTAEMQILTVIIENETRQIKMTDICRSIDMPKSTFSRHISTLEGKKLVDKFHPEYNRKNIIIRTTALGRRVFEGYSQYIFNNVFGKVFAALDEIPGEYIDALTDAVKLWQNLSIRDVK